MTTVEMTQERTAQDARASAKNTLMAWQEEHATQVNWFLSLVSAGLMLWATVQWWDRAFALTRPCVTAELPTLFCGEVPEYLQGFQFVVAVLGIATAVTSALLSVAQAILGRTLPIMRYVVGLVLASAALWVAAYWFGRAFHL